MEDEIALSGGGRTAVSRRGDVVLRAAGPWSATVIKLLRHLESAGFSQAPRVVGSGFDEWGRETLSFIEGDFVHPDPWTDNAIYIIGSVLKQLHEATASFVVPRDAVGAHGLGAASAKAEALLAIVTPGRGISWHVPNRLSL